MSEKLIAVLKKSKLFAGFTQKQLEEVVEHLQPRPVTLKSGDRVYKRGNPSDRCWLIQSGKLMLKRSSLRSPFRHMIYNKGSVTGIQGLVAPGSTRAVSMIADGKVQLIEITHDGVDHLNTDTKILFWENVSKILMRKLTVCLSQEQLPEE